MQKSFFLLLAGVIVVVLVLIGGMLFTDSGQEVVLSTQEEERPVVAVSIFPLAELTRAIAGDRADVLQLIPSNVEPHDAEPSARDIVAAQQADILVFNGESIDAWVQDLQGMFNRSEKSWISVQSIVQALPPGVDPSLIDIMYFDQHAWFGLDTMQRFVQEVRNLLIVVDPEGSADYTSRADALIARLRILDEQYRTSLANCALNDIIVTHDAFGVLAQRYNFTAYAVLGVTPDEEPSARDLAELVEQIRTLHVPVVFFEDAASPDIAETLAREAGVTTDILSPIEMGTPDPMLQAAGYFDPMEANLAALQRALLCQP